MFNTITIQCDTCGKPVTKSVGHVNRARKLGMGLFCDRICFGISRRIERSEAEKKEIKRLYDIQYRADNGELLREKKRKYEQSPDGRAMQKRNRDKFKENHLAYCRTDEYRKWKHDYDQQHQAKKNYGDLWESALVLRDIIKEIEPEIKEVKIQKGTYNKSQKRKRLWNSMQRTLNKHFGTPSTV